MKIFNNLFKKKNKISEQEKLEEEKNEKKQHISNNLILESLNEEQIKAVMTTEGYVRVIAGAGTGKTKALANRYSYLVEELGVSTSNILCVTFTNKAAKEMKKRIRKMIGDKDTGLVCTFHGFGVYLLKEDIHVLNYPKNFFIMDDEDIETILKKIYEENNLNTRSFTFKNAKEYIESYKNHNIEYIDLLTILDTNLLKEKYINEKQNFQDKVLFGYLYEQRKCYGLDFNDLINFTLYILEHFEEKREKWQKNLMYIMVDEFQDVSAKQYALVDILSDYHKNLFVVGDPDQTIYSWRGAKIDFLLNFEKKYNNVKTIILNKNYRSTPNILNASNSLINKNKKRIEKNLIAIKKADVPVIYNHAKTVTEEVEWIVKQIKLLLESGKKLDDIAVLYRAHFISRSIE